MISKSQASQIADEVVAAGRRDRTWRSGFTRPLPHWFRGPHLAGLSDYEHHASFDEMSRRALRRPGWVLATLAIVAAVLVPALYIAWLPPAALAMWPAVIVMMSRHYTLRREFAKDARAFAARAANTVPVEPLPRERA